MAPSISKPRQVPQTGKTSPAFYFINKYFGTRLLPDLIGEQGEVHQVGGGRGVGRGVDGDSAARDEEAVDTSKYLVKRKYVY